METRKTPLALTASALAMALMLVGCGGGSSSSTPQPTVAAAPAPTPDPMPEPEPEPEPTVHTVSPLDEMPMDYMAPMASMMTVAAGGTWNPEGSDVVFSCPAGGEACDITIAANGTVTSTGGAANAALTMAAAERLGEEKEMMAAEMKGRAMGLSDALTDTTGTRGVMIRGDEKGDMLAITHGMVSVDGQSGWETKAAGMSISDPWKGMTLSRKTHHYTVYSNIEAPKRTPFTSAYALDGENDTTLDEGPLTGVIIAAAEDDGHPYRLEFNTDGQLRLAAIAGYLDSTNFPQPGTPGSADLEYTYDGEEGNKAKKFAGTFRGAPGTYECYSASCTVTAEAPSTEQGRNYAATGMWYFTPDSRNNPTVVVTDADHLHFGWWENKPTKAVSGQYLYDAQVFAGGSLPFNVEATINALHGDAKYNGPAVGLFAIKEDAKNEITATHGEFMATADLTAAFGNTTTPGNVSGKIGSFVRSDGVANDWALTLNKTNISATGSNAGDGNIVDGASVIGKWNYQLYGSGAKSANPTGIAGAFNAKITGEDKSVAAVAGAFGATAK